MKICILHRFPQEHIKETNASFPYILRENVEVKTFKSINRINNKLKYLKSLLWIFYAPFLVLGRNYDVIYCDDSFPFYPILVKIASPKSKIVLRLGDLHLCYYFSGQAYDILHRIEKIGWDKADRILAISETMAEYIREETDTEVEVILDPIDPRDFPIKTEEKSNHVRVMFHGLLTANKNVDMLVEAAKKLPDINFYIIGDGPEFSRINAIAPKNLFMLCWQPFPIIHNWINRCDIGIALRGKNFGNEVVVTSPFLQYSIMAKPCIVSARKVFDDMDYLWQFDTLQELIEMIQMFSDKEFAKHEGEKMRKYILGNHDAKKIGEQIYGILSNIE